MNVKIIIIGVVHYDPLGRNKVVSLLHTLKNEMHFLPDAIAVEWDETHHIRVVEQRKKFRDHIEKQFCHLNKNQIETLAHSLGYEADSHNEVFPNIPVIWLDEGRVDIDNNLVEYTNCRLNLYKEFFPKVISDEETLSVMSQNASAWNAKYYSGSLFRDKEFFEMSCNAVNNGLHRIISIVGAEHGNVKHEGAYVNLLLNAGYNVITYLLD